MQGSRCVVVNTEVPAFVDIERVMGKTNYKGVNQRRQYATVNCDPSYKGNTQGDYDEEQ